MRKDLADGAVMPCRRIGGSVIKGDITAFVRNLPLRADILGRVGEWVARGTKIGDIDPRAGSPGYCFIISDKALSVGGGVLEANINSLPSSKCTTFLFL